MARGTEAARGLGDRVENAEKDEAAIILLEQQALGAGWPGV